MAEPIFDESAFDQRPAGAIPAGPMDELATAQYEMVADATAGARRGQRDIAYGARGLPQGPQAPSPDDSVMVEFYTNLMDGMEHIKMRFPGDQKQELDVLATDHYRLRFQRQYMAFKRQESQFAGHTMLRDMPWVDEAMRNVLALNNVLSVEQAAMMNDAACMSIGPGGRAIRDKAKEYLGGRESAVLTQEHQSLRETVARLEAKNIEQAQQIQQLLDLHNANQGAPAGAEAAPPRQKSPEELAAEVTA